MITGDAISTLITVVKVKLDSNELMLWWRQLILTSFKKFFLTMEVMKAIHWQLKEGKEQTSARFQMVKRKSNKKEENEDGKREGAGGGVQKDRRVSPCEKTV